MKTKNIRKYKNLRKTLKNAKKTRKNIIYGGKVERDDNWFIQIVNDCCKQFWLNDPRWKEIDIKERPALGLGQDFITDSQKKSCIIGTLGYTGQYKIGKGFILDQKDFPTDNGKNHQSLYYYPFNLNPFSLGVYRKQNWVLTSRTTSKKNYIIGHHFAKSHIHFFNEYRKQPKCTSNVFIAGWPHGSTRDNQIRNITNIKDLKYNIDIINNWQNFHAFDADLAKCIICKMIKYFANKINTNTSNQPELNRLIASNCGNNYTLKPEQKYEDIINNILIDEFNELKTETGPDNSIDIPNKDIDIDMTEMMCGITESMHRQKLLKYNHLLNISIIICDIHIPVDDRIKNFIKYIKKENLTDFFDENCNEINLLNKLFELFHMEVTIETTKYEQLQTDVTTEEQSKSELKEQKKLKKQLKKAEAAAGAEAGAEAATKLTKAATEAEAQSSVELLEKHAKIIFKYITDANQDPINQKMRTSIKKFNDSNIQFFIEYFHMNLRENTIIQQDKLDNIIQENDTFQRFSTSLH